MEDRLIKAVAIAILSLFMYAPNALAKKLSVTLLVPEPAGGSFWGQYVRCMRAAAEDLEIELKVVNAQSNSYSIKRKGLAAINEAPDYFITGFFVPELNSTFLKATESNNTKFFHIDVIPQGEQKSEIGRPREKYSSWIGGMAQNNVNSGYQLADALIHIAKRTGKVGDDNMIRVAAIAGEDDSSSGNMKLQGLKRRISLDSDVILLDTKLSTWTRETGEQSASDLFETYYDMNILWTVADELALGAIDAAESNGVALGKDVLLGGMAWAPEAVRQIELGNMAASWGGQIFEAGWALVLIYDYHHGMDFANELGTEITTPMSVLTKRNVADYTEVFGDKEWAKINFKKLSKKLNPNIKKYNFSLETLKNTLQSGFTP